MTQTVKMTGLQLEIGQHKITLVQSKEGLAIAVEGYGTEARPNAPVILLNLQGEDPNLAVFKDINVGIPTLIGLSTAKEELRRPRKKEEWQHE